MKLRSDYYSRRVIHSAKFQSPGRDSPGLLSA
jgi:hypothetical protein